MARGEQQRRRTAPTTDNTTGQPLQPGRRTRRTLRGGNWRCPDERRIPILQKNHLTLLHHSRSDAPDDIAEQAPVQPGPRARRIRRQTDWRRSDYRRIPTSSTPAPVPAPLGAPDTWIDGDRVGLRTTPAPLTSTPTTIGEQLHLPYTAGDRQERRRMKPALTRLSVGPLLTAATNGNNEH